MTIRNYQNHSPKIHEQAFVDESALVLGDVEIGEHSSIWPMTVVRGDVQKIRIGKYSNVQDGSVCHVTHKHGDHAKGFPLTIGDFVTLGHKVIAHGCTINDFCLIGMGSTLMDGALIQSEVIVGANSLVPPGKELSTGYLWLGSPVKRVRKLTEEERNYFKYTANFYADLKEKHRADI